MTESNRSSYQNQLPNPTTKISEETAVAKLSTPLQSQERRLPNPLDETRNSRRDLSTVADYQPINDEPTTPLVSPADESLVGSMETRDRGNHLVVLHLSHQEFRDPASVNRKTKVQKRIENLG